MTIPGCSTLQACVLRVLAAGFGTAACNWRCSSSRQHADVKGAVEGAVFKNELHAPVTVLHLSADS